MPIVARLLAIILLLVAVPIVIAPSSSAQGPALTLDICHPVRALATTSFRCELPLPTVGARARSLPCLGSAEGATTMLMPRAAAPPATPPPKA